MLSSAVGSSPQQRQYQENSQVLTNICWLGFGLKKAMQPGL